MLPLYQLVFGRDVLFRELCYIDLTILVSVKLLENFVHDLASVLVVNAALGQENIHFISVNFSVSVSVELSKLLLQSQSLIDWLGSALFESFHWTSCRLCSSPSKMVAASALI